MNQITSKIKTVIRILDIYTRNWIKPERVIYTFKKQNSMYFYKHDFRFEIHFYL
jgi:hypothetical protein